eukprot:scaffold1974_cov395-Prasinococcus_capsulatus_cf.AAC.6
MEAWKSSIGVPSKARRSATGAKCGFRRWAAFRFGIAWSGRLELRCACGRWRSGMWPPTPSGAA